MLIIRLAGEELSQSARRLRASPGFALTMILALALGIGCSAAVFSVVQARLLRPLPYPDSTELVQIHNSYPGLGLADAMSTVPDYLDLRDQALALADSALYYRYGFDLVGHGVPQRMTGVVATPSLFSTLGVAPALGRVFAETEAESGSARVVVLSHATWTQQFNADPQILGREIRLGGSGYRVIGVMPERFAFPRRDVQLWVPFVFSERQRSDAMRGFEFAESVGRLRPDSTLEQLRQQLGAIVERNLQRIGAQAGANDESFRERVTRTGFQIEALPLHQRLNGDLAATLQMLQAAALMLWLIACANSAGLLLIRQHGRLREYRLRAALGASRGRLAATVLSESLLLALSGGMLSIAVAQVGIALIRSLGLDGAEFGIELRMDAMLLAIVAAVSLLSALLCAMPPLAMLMRFGARLSDSAHASLGAGAARPARNGLVVLQLALAVALLLGGAVLHRSYVLLQRQDPGFDAAGLVTASLQLSSERYRDPVAAASLQQRLLTAVRELPGVQSVGSVSGLPFSGDFDSNPYYVDGGDSRQATGSGYYQLVDPDYFATLQMPILQGRGFEPADSDQAEPVAIIDESLARRAFGDASPLDRRIATRGLQGLQWRRIVGVVAGIKRNALSETEASPTYYFPVAQEAGGRIFRLAIRTDLSLPVLGDSLRAALRSIDPEQTVFDLMSMSERIDGSLAGRRAPLGLVTAFAGGAFALALLGVYALRTYTVSLRRSEFGLRIALGAPAARIMQSVLVETLRLLAIGALIGLCLGYLLLQLLQAHLFGVAPLDPMVAGPVIIAVATAAIAASLPHAWSAARTDPAQVLRGE